MKRIIGGKIFTGENDRGRENFSAGLNGQFSPDRRNACIGRWQRGCSGMDGACMRSGFKFLPTPKN